MCQSQGRVAPRRQLWEKAAPDLTSYNNLASYLIIPDGRNQHSYQALGDILNPLLEQEEDGKQVAQKSPGHNVVALKYKDIGGGDVKVEVAWGAEMCSAEVL